MPWHPAKAPRPGPNPSPAAPRRRGPADRPTSSGWWPGRRPGCSAIAAARDLFEVARKIDPNYARAYAGLAWAYADDYDYEWTDDYDKTLKLALENASTAVRLDPNDYQAHWALGWAYLYNRQHERAIAHYLRARDLNPNDAELLAEMANFLIFIGQPKQAVDQVKEAIRLNPFHENWYLEYLGWAYEEAGLSNKALTEYETLQKMIHKNKGYIYYRMAGIYSGQNKIKECADYLEAAWKDRFNVPEYLTSDLRFKNFRETPAYGAFLEKHKQ